MQISNGQFASRVFSECTVNKPAESGAFAEPSSRASAFSRWTDGRNIESLLECWISCELTCLLQPFLHSLLEGGVDCQ